MHNTTQKKIARQTEICNKLGYSDIKTMLETEYENAGTIRELSCVINVPEMVTGNWLRGAGIPIKHAPHQRIKISNQNVLDMIKSGLTYKKTAEILGCTVGIVNNVMNKTRRCPVESPTPLCACGKMLRANRVMCVTCQRQRSKKARHKLGHDTNIVT